MDKNFYNEASAKKLGWEPSWFGEKYFDDKLVRAIKKWQRQHSIPADGLCGPTTFRRLWTDRQSKIDIYKPSEFSFSIDRNVLSNSNLIIELVRFNDNGKLSTLTNIGTTNKISSGNILTVGMVRFPNQMGKNWTGNFILRSGFKYSHQNIEPTKNIISEIGYSMGFGFKFGATSNQLDINYYVGSRSFKEKFDGENIHQIQAGVSLSDIWFVKRRQKK